MLAGPSAQRRVGRAVSLGQWLRTLEQRSLLFYCIIIILTGQWWVFSAKTCWTCCRCRSGVRTLEQSSLLLCYILCWLDNGGSSAQRRVGRAVGLGQG